MSSIAAKARRIRHCCSVRPWSRSEGRKCRMTASRARSNDIGSERENSRIGTRRAPGLPAGLEGKSLDDFFRAIVNVRPSEIAHLDEFRSREVFAPQQAFFGLIRF